MPVAFGARRLSLLRSFPLRPLIVLVVGIVAFGYRFLSQGRLPNDHYMHLAWAQQVLLGDMPGKDFVDPGMPLMYGLSTAVQYLWPGPFSETVLTSGLMAVAAAITFVLVSDITGSAVAGLAAASVQVGLATRLYGHPKILIPALVLWALCRYARTATRVTMIGLAAAVAVAILLRHDLGLFAFAAASVGLVVRWVPEGRRARRAVLQLAAATTVSLVPYLVLVQLFEGWVERIREGLEFGRGEAHQLMVPWKHPPALDLAGSADDVAVVALYYVAYALIPLCLIALWVARRRDRHVAATVAAAVTLLTCYCLIILRHPLAARVPDLAAILSITGAWLAVESGRGVHRWVGRPVVAPLATAAAMVVILTAPLAAVWQLAHVADHVEKSRLGDGWRKVSERVQALAKVGTEWPWAWYWPGGDLPEAVRYVSQCTAPTDRILITWFAPEYYFFSQRGFAAGHAMFSSAAAFATAKDDDKMVARIRSERVPLVFRNEGSQDGFARAHPKLNAFIDDHYTWFDQVSLRDGSVVRMGVRRDLQSNTPYQGRTWPCRLSDGGRPRR